MTSEYDNNLRINIDSKFRSKLEDIIRLLQECEIHYSKLTTAREGEELETFAELVEVLVANLIYAWVTQGGNDLVRGILPVPYVSRLRYVAELMAEEKMGFADVSEFSNVVQGKMTFAIRPGTLLRRWLANEEDPGTIVKAVASATPDIASNPLDHSRLLDVHTWSDHPEANDFVKKIDEAHFADWTMKKLRQHLKVVLLDLYVAWSEDPELRIAYHRDVNHYLVKTRYNELKISKKTPDIVDRLVEVRLVEQEKGFYDRREGGSSRVSRIWPTPELIDLFKEAKFGPLDIGNAKERECIVLRDVDPRKSDRKFDKEYDDTPETKEMRVLLSKYNGLLRKTFIDVPTLETGWIDLGGTEATPKRLYVNQRDKFVRRIFNRGSWEKGGRYWGGWWQRCPKEWRKQIFIDDKPTVELDYSGLHIVLLYAGEDIDYWRDVGSDPYSISMPGFLDTQERTREVCKGLILVALNARDDRSTFQAFREAAETGSLEKKLKDAQLAELLAALRSKHEPIATKFASDAGIDLMKVDSQITGLIIEQFTEREMPVLTIHDSYIVPDGQDRLLEESMARAFETITGKSGVRLKQASESNADILAEHESLRAFDIRNPARNTLLAFDINRRANPVRTRRYLHMHATFQDWLARGSAESSIEGTETPLAGL